MVIIKSLEDEKGKGGGDEKGKGKGKGADDEEVKDTGGEKEAKGTGGDAGRGTRSEDGRGIGGEEGVRDISHESRELPLFLVFRLMSYADICRFRVVSKGFRSLIHDFRFGSMLLNQSSCDAKLFVCRHKDCCGKLDAKLIENPMDGNLCTVSTKSNFPFMHFSALIGVCKDFVALYNKNNLDEFGVYDINLGQFYRFSGPSYREKVVEEISGGVGCFGGDTRLVVVVYCLEEAYSFYYSLSSRMWHRLDLPAVKLPEEPGVALNNNLYWLNYRTRDVIAYDGEGFNVMANIGIKGNCIGVVGGQLCISEIVNRSYVKLYLLLDNRLVLYTLVFLTCCQVVSSIKPLFLMMDGSIVLLADNENLFSYNLHKKKPVLYSSFDVPKYFEALPYLGKSIPDRISSSSSVNSDHGQREVIKRVTVGFGVGSEEDKLTVMRDYRMVGNTSIQSFVLLCDNISAAAHYFRENLLQNIWQRDLLGDPRTAIEYGFFLTEAERMENKMSGNSMSMVAFLIDGNKVCIGKLGGFKSIICRNGVVEDLTLRSPLKKEYKYVVCRDFSVPGHPEDFPRAVDHHTAEIMRKDPHFMLHCRAVPQVIVELLEDDVDAIIFATDCLLEVFSSHEVVDIVREFSAKKAADRLTKMALFRGCVGGTTCIVLKFQ